MKAVSFLAMSLMLLVAGLSARGDEQKIPLTEVPESAMKAVKQKFPHAELKEASKEVEKNKTTYEISLVSGGKHITVGLNDKGKIEEIETEIAVSDLPKTVTDAIHARYPKSTLKKAEEIVEIEDGEEEKAYEVDVTTSKGKSVEVKVDAKGKIEDDEDNENTRDGDSR